MVGQITRQRNLPHSLRRHAREKSCTQALVPVLSESRAFGEHKAEERLPSPPLCCNSTDCQSAGCFPRRCCENRVAEVTSAITA